MEERFDAHVLIDKLQTVCHHTLLNKEQKDRFIEAEVFRYLLMLNEDDLPALRASWRMSH